MIARKPETNSMNRSQRNFATRAKHRTRYAFTLIEILATVAILGLAGALIIPRLSDLPSFETEAAVRQIVADLSFAQSDAMARQTKRRVLFEADGSGYRLLGDDFTVDEDELYDPIAHNGDQRYIINFATDERYQYVSIESATFDTNNKFITYDELGGPIDNTGGPSTGGTIIVNGQAERFQITVAPFTGSVTVTKL